MRHCFFFIGLILVPLLTHGQITKNLSLGENHEEVKTLQILLNSDPRTAVAQSGVGSSGQETTYFGSLTQRAVMRFQALYANEILSPSGLSSPTGFVGLFSRQKLNTLFSQKSPMVNTSVSSVPSTPDSLSEIPVSLLKEESASSLGSLLFAVKPSVYALSLYSAKPGDSIEIYGTGFEEKNTVSFSEREVEGTSRDGGTIKVMVPYDLPLGNYNISVKNTKGSSYNASFGEYFTVTSATNKRPEIISISPQTIKLSDTQKQIVVTVKTEGKKVSIGTSVGVPSGASKNGDSFSFSLETISGFSALKTSLDKNETVNFPLSIYVKDEHGFSPNPAMLYIQKQ